MIGKKLKLLAGLLLPAMILSGTVHAFTLDGEMVQGGMVIGHALPGSAVELNDKPVRVDEQGRFVIGFGRDHKSSARLQVQEPGRKLETRTLNIAARTYKTQRINGLPRKMVTPPDGVIKRIRRENAEIARVRALDTAKSFFSEAWRWPSIGRISGVFGSQRILNGKPRRPHYGIDIAAPTGADVVAPTDAMVRMAEKDLYFTGGTVMLDHGHGVTSVYSHLSALDVKPGQQVKAGQKIGEVGSTGRSTGPHLDWRVNWFRERLDPALLVGPMPSSPR